MIGSMSVARVSPKKLQSPCARLRGGLSWSHLPIWEPRNDSPVVAYVPGRSWASADRFDGGVGDQARQVRLALTASPPICWNPKLGFSSRTVALPQQRIRLKDVSAAP